MISIIDCGIGNLGSITNMLKYLGAKSEIINSKEQVLKSEKLIFPGVGSWDNGIKKIRENGILDALNIQILNKSVNLLGICLGMQLLFESSEEGTLAGFGWIPGDVKKFNFKTTNIDERKLNVPHMGWNSVSSCRKTPLNENLGSDARFYFVHSYFATCKDKSHVVMTCDYGDEFDCAVNKENIWGVQFHPEKSHKFGIQLMKNFTEL